MPYISGMRMSVTRSPSADAARARRLEEGDRRSVERTARPAVLSRKASDWRTSIIVVDHVNDSVIRHARPPLSANARK